MNASRTSSSTSSMDTITAAVPGVRLGLSADDSTDDESSPQPPSLSIRPGGGVLGELEAEVMVTIDPTL